MTTIRTLVTCNRTMEHVLRQSSCRSHPPELHVERDFIRCTGSRSGSLRSRIDDAFIDQRHAAAQLADPFDQDAHRVAHLGDKRDVAVERVAAGFVRLEVTYITVE